jgi:DNA-binding transcriptional LysR family regulator
LIIRNFEYLLALNREKHFARAAAACSVSQPTLSAGIKQLEEDMDVLIVKRGQRFEGLTLEGERVLSWAQQMLEDCMRLKQELHGLRNSRMRGPFRLGMIPATAALASVLSVAFADQFLELQISMDTGEPEHLCNLVRQGEMDVALMYLDEAVSEGLDVYSLYRERLFLLTRMDVDNSRRVSWDDVAALPLCLLKSAVPRTAEAQLGKAPRVLHTDSATVLAAHVGTGRWATVLPQSLVSILPKSPTLRAIGIAKPNEQVNVGFVTVKRDPLPVAVHALMETAHTPILVNAIREMLATFEDYASKRSRKFRNTPTVCP